MQAKIRLLKKTPRAIKISNNTLCKISKINNSNNKTKVNISKIKIGIQTKIKNNNSKNLKRSNEIIPSSINIRI